MFGIGLVFGGCKLILRFARRYFNQHLGDYTEAQQLALVGLFDAANAVERLLTLTTGE
jgi:hypothetical protein